MCRSSAALPGGFGSGTLFEKGTKEKTTVKITGFKTRARDDMFAELISSFPSEVATNAKTGKVAYTGARNGLLHKDVVTVDCLDHLRNSSMSQPTSAITKTVGRNKEAVLTSLGKPAADGLVIKDEGGSGIITGDLMEARVGIEPTYKGFADLSLTTWVPRPGLKYSESRLGFQPGKQNCTHLRRDAARRSIRCRARSAGSQGKRPRRSSRGRSRR